MLQLSLKSLSPSGKNQQLYNSVDIEFHHTNSITYSLIICLPLRETYICLGFVYVRLSVTLPLSGPYLLESSM